MSASIPGSRTVESEDDCTFAWLESGGGSGGEGAGGDTGNVVIAKEVISGIVGGTVDGMPMLRREGFCVKVCARRRPPSLCKGELGRGVAGVTAK